MNIQILNNLPKSHAWKTVFLGRRTFKGILWNDKEVRQNKSVFLYKKWASVHFDSDWYEISAGSVTDNNATRRDICIVKSLLGKNLNKNIKIIDVNCGTGRHLIKLAEENIFGIGMEGASLLRKLGRDKAKANKVPVKIVSTSKYFREKYFESAEIVTSLFNSMGYTFNMNDDIARLKWMVDLLKPKGYFLLDIRAEGYQKKHYAQRTTMDEIIYISTDVKKTPIKITTQKYWKNSTLAAEEKITIGLKHKIVAQHTTYGWRTYSLKELKTILQKIGLKMLKYKFDYYSSPSNLGERIFLLCQKVI